MPAAGLRGFILEEAEVDCVRDFAEEGGEIEVGRSVLGWIDAEKEEVVDATLVDRGGKVLDGSGVAGVGFDWLRVVPMLPRALLIALTSVWSGAGVSGPARTIERPVFAARSAAHSVTQSALMAAFDSGKALATAARFASLVLAATARANWRVNSPSSDALQRRR